MIDAAFFVFAAAAVVSGHRVFRTDSMVRATFLLLASFLNVGAVLVLMQAEYLGVALWFMMTVEMIVMGLFMVMFMMNPAGLNPMSMVHQPRVAALAGIVSAGALSAVAVLADFRSAPVDPTSDSIRQLGEELLGDSMLVFESVGVTLLATMVCAVVLSSSGGRFGDAYDGSIAPPLDPGGTMRPSDDLVESSPDDHGHTSGLGGNGGHNGHGGHGS